jgi:tetratricopeptide (TPR) repeat protein
VLVSAAMAAALASTACSRDPEVLKKEAYERGNQYFEQKKYQEAIIEYRKAIQQDAMYPEARYKLAQAYDQLGDGGNAAREYIRAADLLPNDALAQVRAGIFLLVGGAYEDAKTRAQKALALEPRNAEAQILLAEANASLKNLTGAVEQMEELIRMDPNDARAYTRLAGFKLQQGNPQEAEQAFERAVRLAPHSIDAALGLSQFYMSVGRTKDAEEWLKKAVGIDPKNPLANRALAAYYMSTGRLPEAEAPLKAFVDAAPNHAPRLTLADYYYRAGKPDEARKILDGLTGDRALVPDVQTRLAILDRNANHDADAYKRLDDVLKSNPNSSRALVLKGRYLAADKKFDEAIATLRKAIDVDPKLGEAHYWIGIAYMDKGDREAAKTEFTEVLSLEPTEVGSKLQLAQIHLAEGNLDAAAELASQAVANQPGNGQARLVLIDVQLARGELKTAAHDAALLAKMLPNRAEVQLELGRVYARQGDNENAESALTKAIELSGGSNESVGNLVDLRIRTNRLDAARQLVDQQIAKHPDNAWLQIYSARIAYRANDQAATEAALKKALALDPSNVQGYVELSNLYAAQRRMDEARAQLERVVAEQPNAIWAQTMIAISLHVENRKDDARKWYERILAADPNAAMAANNLAMLDLESGNNLDIALQHAQVAKQQLPDSPEVNDTLGLIYLKKGLGRLALPAFEVSAARDPDNAVYHYHLAQAYAATGDRAKARASLMRALKVKSDFDGASEARRMLAEL